MLDFLYSWAGNTLHFIICIPIIISEDVEYFVLILTFLKSKWRITYLSILYHDLLQILLSFFDQNSVAARDAYMYSGIYLSSYMYWTIGTLFSFPIGIWQMVILFYFRYVFIVVLPKVNRKYHHISLLKNQPALMQKKLIILVIQRRESHKNCPLNPAFLN